MQQKSRERPARGRHEKPRGTGRIERNRLAQRKVTGVSKRKGEADGRERWTSESLQSDHGTSSKPAGSLSRRPNTPTCVMSMFGSPESWNASMRFSWSIILTTTALNARGISRSTVSLGSGKGRGSTRSEEAFWRGTSARIGAKRQRQQGGARKRKRTGNEAAQTPRDHRTTVKDAPAPTHGLIASRGHHERRQRRRVVRGLGRYLRVARHKAPQVAIFDLQLSLCVRSLRKLPLGIRWGSIEWIIYVRLDQLELTVLVLPQKHPLRVQYTQRVLVWIVQVDHDFCKRRKEKRNGNERVREASVSCRFGRKRQMVANIEREISKTKPRRYAPWHPPRTPFAFSGSPTRCLVLWCPGACRSTPPHRATNVPPTLHHHVAPGPL